MAASGLCAAPEIIDLTAAARQAKAYTATESSVKQYAHAEFDGNFGYTNDCWYSDPNAENPLDQWVQIQFKDTFRPGEFLCPRSYAIYYHKSACGDGTAKYPRKLPKSWTFEGSTDGVTWTVLDSQEGWNKWSAGTWSEFQFFTTECYRYYRLHMTAVCNADAAHQYYVIPELKINGEVFAAAQDARRVRQWTGGTTGDWFDAANWTAGAEGATPPQAGDDVRVSQATTILLTNSTPALKILSLGGSATSVATTLVCSNWTTCVSAETVEIGPGGKLTCSSAEINSADYTTQTVNRVFVSCETFTLAAGASIAADTLGWRAWPAMASKRGFGPGAPAYDAQYSISPSHGGHGANWYNPQYTAKRCARPYGNAAAPTTAGSSGAATPWGLGKNGGGVVRIVATGDVTVDGTISANGGSMSGYGGQAGSGGSVWISCRSLSGAGTISAKGGDGYSINTGASREALPAGGGRIAVDYVPSAQAVADVTGMKITAASGVFGSGGHATHADAETYFRYRWAGEGTLHFTDATLVDQLIGSGLSGEIRGLTDYEREGDLDFTYGFVRFAEDGVKVHVKGSLALSGTDARLDIGGSVMTNRYLGATLYAGSVASSLTVDGDLTLEGVSCLDIRAAGVSGSTVGATVTVGGTMSVGSGSFVIARSDLDLPSSPRFVVGNLTVAEGGSMTASFCGGKGGFVGSSSTYRGIPGIAEGAPWYSSAAGASHGGVGAHGTLSKENWSAVYDDALRPVYPGSGGGNKNNNWWTGGSGGGVIAVAAPNGTIRINGLVEADGEAGTLVSHYCGGGGAGGTILLEAEKFFCGATGRLSAVGGASNPDSDTSNPKAAYCGGGGRISVFAGFPYAADVKKGRLHTVETPFAATDYPEEFEFLGTYSVAGGQPVGELAETNGYPGGDGTIRFTYVKDKQGLMLLFR